MKKIFSTLIIILFTMQIAAQLKVGDNPTTIDDNSVLEVESTTKAFVPPRMTTVEMNNISTPLEGALVYNTDLKCLHMRANSVWKSMCGKTGEITSSIRTADFDGWYLLDGRAISSLPANAQTVAAALGLSGNLPDASGKFLKTKNNDAETILSIGGQNGTTLTQANLPNVTFNGTAASAGSHSHSGTANAAGNHSHSYIDRGNTTFSRGNSGTLSPIADNTSGSYSTGAAGNHAHSLTVNANGNHAHSVSVSSGGSDTSINNQPNYLVVNTFIYLGE